MAKMDSVAVAWTRQKAVEAAAKPAYAQTAEDHMAIEGARQLERGILFGTKANPRDPPLIFAILLGASMLLRR